MATAQIDGVVQSLRALVRSTADGRSDGELLDCYLVRREAAAFESLVRRHGPMVLGVCRRILRHQQDAEDAFQVTFLVLLRRGESVRPRTMVGNWLHGVAVRTALKAKAVAAARFEKEKAVAHPEARESMVANDWEPLLDEELSRLPDKYRLPLILCDLQGKTRTEAARELGWREGTVAGQLARARALLAQRLSRRGVTLSVGAMAAGLAGQASTANLSGSLVTKTVGLVASAGGPTAITASVSTLTEAVVKIMFVEKLKAASLCAAVVGVFAMVTAACGYVALAGEPTSVSPRAGVATDGLAPASGQPRPEEKTPKQDPKAFDLNRTWSQGKAEGKGPVRFTHPPMRVEDVERILPYGLMVGAHVAPIDHGYYFPKALKPGQEHYDVFAPADGFVVMVGHRVQLAGSSEKAREYDDYALIIEHSGTFYTQYDLLTSLDAKIMEKLDAATLKRFKDKQPGPTVNVRVPVKAGQLLGKVGGRSLDFAVIKGEVTLKGFLTPALYGHYGWRVHVVDPFDYFDEPLRGKLLKLNPRTAEPRGGKIDFDVDGRAVGNWFKEGTGGYAGNKDKRGYWTGHLALAYHPIDPSVVIVSVGDFDGKPRQFAVEGNGPDPAKVSAKDGVVKYELRYAAINNSGERIELPREMRGVQGVLLLEVLDGRKLKAEVFPGKSTKDVTGFTKAAAVYER